VYKCKINDNLYKFNVKIAFSHKLARKNLFCFKINELQRSLGSGLLKVFQKAKKKKKKKN